MEITEGKLLSRAKLEGKKLHVLEDVLIDTGAALTVIPPEIADINYFVINYRHVLTPKPLKLFLINHGRLKTISTDNCPPTNHNVTVFFSVNRRRSRSNCLRKITSWWCSLQK
jgi:hypothetical protein